MKRITAWLSVLLIASLALGGMAAPSRAGQQPVATAASEGGLSLVGHWGGSTYAAAPAGQAQAVQQVMPDGLMSALLAASAQPFTGDAEGYHGRSGGLEFTLGTRGLQADGVGWGVALTGMGRGARIAPVPAAEVVEADSCLEYRRGALTEWYRDTTMGLEQGFTIEQAPPGEGDLVLRLELTAAAAGVPDANGDGLSFALPGGQTLRYDHLRAWDADGEEVEARLLSAPGQVLIQVSEQGAAYPLTVDPLLYVEHKLIASGEAYDWFGYSVSLWGDTAVVGAPNDTVGANADQGSAYVFVRSGTSWGLQQTLTASDGEAGDYFGGSVAIAGDTAVVGAPLDDVGANADQGSAYVFVRSGTSWSEQTRLTASDGEAGDYFGGLVALAGNTAVVGASADDVGANADQGSAYVFVRSGTSWGLQQTLTASDGEAADLFGWSVSLWGDTAVVGAPYDTVGANANQGSAYVFVRSGTSWGLREKLTASDGAAEDGFGRSVAVSGDTVVVGAPHDDVGANANQGSAYVFVRGETSWGLQEKLTASDGEASDYFWQSVAVSGDTAVVGAPYDDVGANNYQGSAYIYEGLPAVTPLYLPLVLRGF